MLRMCKKRIPIGEVIIQMRVVESVIYCCNIGVVETYQHLFYDCPDAQIVSNYVTSAAGVQGPFQKLRNNIDKWWKVECAPKLNIVFIIIPSMVIWHIWKRRSVI